MQEMQEMRVQILGQEDPLEEEMATLSSILSWRIPWTEDPWVTELDRTARLPTFFAAIAHFELTFVKV